MTLPFATMGGECSQCGQRSSTARMFRRHDRHLVCEGCAPTSPKVSTCQIIVGDCRDVLKTLPDASVDSIVTDPPYHLTTGKKGGSGEASLNVDSPAGRARVSTGFMGQKWDGGNIAHDVEMWRECLRVLKPGGHLLAFSGTRTYHRMVCAIEDAGFEIRDQIGWAYGSGFPKSLNVSKAIDAAAGAEREVIATVDPRGMFDGAQRKSSAINTHWREAEGRSDVRDLSKKEVTVPVTEAAKQWDGWGTALKPAWEPIVMARKPLIGTVAENVQAHGCGALNIDGCRVPIDENADASQLRTMQRGQRTEDQNGQVWGLSKGGGDQPSVVRADGRWPANLIHDGSEEVIRAFPQTKSGTLTPDMNIKASTGWSGGSSADRVKSSFEANEGSAARFFYCAKASGDDRGDDNTHPTVKPNDLMRYLVRLVTRKGGVVLDHFAGSGSTGRAALEEGMSAILIEQDTAFAELCKQRTSNLTPGLGL